MWILLASIVGCADDPAVPTPPQVQPQQKPAQADSGVARLGKVVEVLNSAERYTFARMDACGSLAWVAGPKVSIKPGDILEMKGGVGMENFHSDSLGKTFESILFVDSWQASQAHFECGAAASFRGGVATDVQSGGGYTFVKLAYCGVDTWVAGPETSVQRGDRVVTDDGSLMTGFHSKATGRTYKEIYFIQRFRKAKALPPCGS